MKRVFHGILIACLIGVSSAGFAKTIEEFVESKGEDGLYKSVKIEILKGNKRGEGPGPYWPAMNGLPKKIALVSVYLIDQGIYDQNIFLPLPTWSTALPGQTANAIAGYYERQTVPLLKEELAARGVELLTPEEFLLTDEQKAFYRTFDPKYGAVVTGGMKWMDKLLASGGNPEMATAPGYRMFPTNLLFNDKDGANAMRELAEALDVDAVMGIAIQTRTGKKETQLIDMTLNLYGPNPIPPEERRGMKFLWYDGQPYGTATAKLKKIDIIQYDLKKENTEMSTDMGIDYKTTTITTHYSQITKYASVDGLDQITVIMTRKLLNDIEKKIGG